MKLDINLISGTGVIDKNQKRIIYFNDESIIIETPITIRRHNYQSNTISDTILLHIHKKLYSTLKFTNNLARIDFSGNIRTYWPENAEHMLLVVYCNSCNVIDDYESEFESDYNLVEIEGTLCKHPKSRSTPKGKYITDLFIASNYMSNKSAYIPCICWNQLASYAEKELKYKDKIIAKGNLQSRIYTRQSDKQEYTITEFSIQSYYKITTKENENEK